jgi:hypothetical protein
MAGKTKRMTLIKDLIHIPERVQRGDFVLNLASGLEADAVEQTLKDYVVTPQLARCFEDALSFVKNTATSAQNRNKGAYLHGSFGTGKSHFMAVLHLLLQGNVQARAIPELGPAVAKHSDWMQSRNILLVPYHMIGAASIEAGVLGGYARHIRKLHPDAPVPGFYMSGRLFEDARAMRGHVGDERFFAALNAAGGAGGASGGGDDGWGDAATGWDVVSFDAVLSGQACEHDRDRLVSDLVGSLFTSFADLANTQSGGYLEFDEGLRVMTRHAKALGYDAVILFLDELILWLASRLSDRNFINSEIQKVVKLVETGIPRELPVISFIARQRDLREFVGDQYSGVEQEILSDSLKYWEGRFHTITLEDRNLPVIAQRRLLSPVDAAARGQIEAAFARTEKMREDTFNLLLTSQGDREMFRALYPFSPALVQALVALSSALQRERTALKVMLMLLVEQRETLALGSVIPVGDLYDVIASEAEPFSEQMRQHFDNAKLLFERKLIPLLELEHQIGVQALHELPPGDQRGHAFNNDLRLLKTLVLAALVPEVESFKQLTATKLAALNHGTIRSPIPGQEARTVLQKCRKWAGQVGEIKISEDTSPIIGMQLSGWIPRASSSRRASTTTTVTVGVWSRRWSSMPSASATTISSSSSTLAVARHPSARGGAVPEHPRDHRRALFRGARRSVEGHHRLPLRHRQLLADRRSGQGQGLRGRGRTGANPLLVALFSQSERPSESGQAGRAGRHPQERGQLQPLQPPSQPAGSGERSDPAGESAQPTAPADEGHPDGRLRCRGTLARIARQHRSARIAAHVAAARIHAETAAGHHHGAGFRATARAGAGVSVPGSSGLF